jgi:hypothetical protein
VGFGSAIKKGFKVIWQGIQVAEPFIGLAGTLLAGTPIGPILIALDALVNRAERDFPAAGSGPEKAEFVTVAGLQVAEIVSGKNVNNPKTRDIVARGAGIVADLKNLETLIRQKRDEYTQFVKDLKDAVASANDPAHPDAPDA